MKEKVLLLHGALGSKEQFSSIKKIIEVAFDVYDLNFEGHGGVASSREISIELFTHNIIDFGTTTSKTRKAGCASSIPLTT